jgi:hypothetical protein
MKTEEQIRVGLKAFKANIETLEEIMKREPPLSAQYQYDSRLLLGMKSKQEIMEWILDEDRSSD